MKGIASILIFVLVVIGIAGTLLFLKNERLSCRVLDWRCQPFEVSDLRGKLTPQARQCILQKLGKEKAYRIAQEIRSKGQIDPDTWTQISSCFGKEAPSTPSTTSPFPTEPGQTTTTSPIFGIHVVFARNTTPDASVIRSLGARVTTLWLYPAPSGRFNISQAKQLVNTIRQQTGGLEILVHIMPNSRSEALGRAQEDPETPEGEAGFSLPTDMQSYLASLRELATALKGTVSYYSIGNEVSGFS